MRIDVSKMFFLLLVISGINNFSVISQSSVLENLPDYGFGFFERVRNQTEFSINIYYDKHPTHDAMPEDSVVRIKNLKNGKYYTVRREGKMVTFKADATDPNDKATLFTIVHRISGNLKSWLGFSHPAANNNMMSVDPDSKMLVFAKKDFLDEGSIVSHWEIVGSSIDSCYLKNRATEGPLSPFTGTRDVKIEPDQEKVEDVQGVWGIKPRFYDTIPQDVPVTIRSCLNNRYAHLGANNHIYVDFTDPFNALAWFVPIRSNRHGWQGFRAANGNNIQAEANRGERWIRPNNRNFYEHGHNWEHFTPLKNNDGSFKFNSRVGNHVGFYPNQNNILRGDFKNTDPSTNFVIEPAPFSAESPVGASLLVAVQQQKGGFSSSSPGVNQAFWYCPPVRKNLRDNNWEIKQGPWENLPGGVSQIALRTQDDAWGIGENLTLWHWINNNWQQVQTQLKVNFVSVSLRGDVWIVDSTNKPFVKTDTGFSPVSTEGLREDKIKQVSIRSFDKSSIEAWGIGIDNQSYYYASDTWKKMSLPDSEARWISLAGNGEVWCVDVQGRVWRYNTDAKKWQTIDCPVKLQQVTVKNKNYAFGISEGWNYELWRWENGKWDRIPGYMKFIAVASGQIVTKIEGKKQRQEIQAATTQAEDGKPLPFDDSCKIKFEVVKLGMGGGIPPQSAGDYVKLPVTQNPKVAGFAKDIIEAFDVSTLLKVSPLLTRGTAWLETALKTPGRTSVSFLARSKDQGDVQVVFGQAISDSYVWRVIIGGWKNTKSAIVRRRYEGNEAIDDVVCEITKEQNPLAATFPGNFTPYWVSIDNGLILVGMGELGDNIFLAWRDPNPPDDVNHVGFGSYKQPVEYTQIQLGSPVVAQKPQRIYFPTKAKTQTTSQPISAAPAKDSFVWSPYPFRTSDNGSICFEIQGKDQAIIALGKDAQNGTDHYALVFGDTDKKDKKGLSLKRWTTDTKKYKDLYFLKEESYPAIALNPGQFKKFWVSFNYGQVIVGQGAFGQNILFICQDLGPLDSIDAIGFGAFGTTAVQARNIQIAPPILVSTEKKAEGYARAKETVAFKGSIIIILPFEYKFSQEGQSVKLDDLVNNRTYYPGATPQQGALYSFMFTVLPNGAPKMDWTKAPTNPQELKLQRELVKLDATADLKQAQAEAIKKAGVIDRSIQEAEAAKTQAGIATAQTITEATTHAGAALTAAGPIGAAVGIGITTASTIAFGVTAGILGSQAAQQQFRGAELEAQAQRKALDKEAEAAQIAFQKKILQGEANFAFRSHDSYVYVDQPERPQLGAASIPQEAIDNKKELVDLLGQADAINPLDDKEKLQTLLTLCQNILFKINHFYVISESEIKQRIFKNLEKLFKAGKQNPASHADLVSVLFSAYNNSFLVNDANPDEAVIKANWLRNINLLAGNFLKQPEFEISGYFGEYIWPLELPQPGVGTITFEASGTNDLFIGFTNDLRQQKTRNTDKEIYEIVIGGWDNNKSAIRIKSLGKSVKERMYEEDKTATLNPNKPEKYWISVNNGLISVGRGTPGQNIFLSWKDPYPIQDLSYVGISSWNAPIAIKNMQISAGLALKAAPKSRRIVRKPKRVPVGTAKAVPSDSAEVAKLEGEEPDIEQEPEEAVKEEEAEVSPEITEAEGEAEEPAIAEAIEVGAD